MKLAASLTLGLGLLIAAPGILAAEPPPVAAAGTTGTAVPDLGKKSIGTYAFVDIAVSNEKAAGAADDYVESFKTELKRRLGERKNTDGLPKAKLDIRLEKVVVQGAFKRGMMGILVPPDLFSASVRAVDEQDQEIAVINIPETKVMASTFGMNWDKMLGIEGAAVIYKQLFGD